MNTTTEMTAADGPQQRRVPDEMSPETPGGPPDSKSNCLLIARRSVFFLALVAAIWLILFWLNRSFFFVRPGAEAIYEIKLRHLQKEAVLPPDPVNSHRVMIFGNSRTLAGFRPDVFDEAVGPKTRSYNAGLPDSDQFVFFLDRLFTVGNRPTHLLLQVPWAGTEMDLSPRQWLQQDARHIESLFPFRTLPRNALIFMFQCRRHGGPVSFYEHCRNETLRMLDQRGYYFISGQSHFPDHRLPADYTLSTDAPDRLMKPRAVSTASQSFARLAEFAETYDFHVYLVPDHTRIQAFAEPQWQDDDTIRALAGHERFHVLGPAYWRYPNSLFADPVHLNEEGAEVYTRQLAQLFRSAVESR